MQSSPPGVVGCWPPAILEGRSLTLGWLQEAVREIYRIGEPDPTLDWISEFAATLSDGAYGPEARRLGRTLRRWRHQIAVWHTSRASNGPTEAVIIGSPDAGVVDLADAVA